MERLDGGCLRPGCCVPDERTGTIGCSRLENCNLSILQRDRIGNSRVVVRDRGRSTNIPSSGRLRSPPAFALVGEVSGPRFSPTSKIFTLPQFMAYHQNLYGIDLKVHEPEHFKVPKKQLRQGLHFECRWDCTKHPLPVFTRS